MSIFGWVVLAGLTVISFLFIMFVLILMDVDDTEDEPGSDELWDEFYNLKDDDG